MGNIFTGDVDGKSAVCFDTGLDPRSFARTKMSQSLIENGYIVYPDGKIEIWKSLGVIEADGYMRVWGSPFTGERLDNILKKADTPLYGEGKQSLLSHKAQQTALQSIVYWIRAKLLLGDIFSAVSPGAAFVSCEDSPEFPKGSVFFVPEHLSQRCLLVEGAEPNYFYCPDLKGIEAAAFCAGAMLYSLLTHGHPYPEAASVYQDMREGFFLSIHLAIPGLDEKLCELINSALLLPVTKKAGSLSGTEILSGFLNLLMDKDSNVHPVDSFFHSLSEEEELKLEKEKKYFYREKTGIVKVKRFISHNKTAVALGSVAAFFVLALLLNLVRSRLERMTTEGMEPDAVIITYYDALNSLDHITMEACLMGADRTDVDMAINFFVIDRVRQAYEFSINSSLISAEVWRQMGNELPAENVFGITDLHIRLLDGSDSEGIMIFGTDYTIWFPHEPHYSIRSDRLTLRRDRRRNWRITEITRTENS